jgi:agmatine deiminase
MGMRTLKVAGIQTAPGNDQSKNVSDAEEQIIIAIQKGAQIICLPELFSTPYFAQYIGIDVTEYSSSVPGSISDRFSLIARRYETVLIIPVCEIGKDGYLYNSAIVIDADGSCFAPYRKIHLPQDPFFYEKDYFHPGDTYRIFKTRFADIAVLICYDQWFPEAARIVSLMGAEIIFFPTAIGHIMGEIPDEGNWKDAWCLMQRSHAIANSVPVVSVNRCSTEKDITFFGGSFICDAFGGILAQAGTKAEIITAEIDPEYGSCIREGWGFFRNRRQDTYIPLVNPKENILAPELMKTPANSGYHMPAEWEPHTGVWISWPGNDETFPDLKRVQQAFLEMITGLIPGETVNLFVADESVMDYVLEQLIKTGNDADKVKFHTGSSPDVWIRDYGPTFIVNRGIKELSAVTWEFNAWGEKYEDLICDGQIALKIVSCLKINSFKPKIIMEGGSFDVNGRGCLLTTRSCLLNPNRNPSLNQWEIEEYLQNYLGVSRIIWLESGIVGDDTDGHIDDIARFVSPDTIVCALEENTEDENYKTLKENYEILCHEKDQNGEPLKIITLPMPGPVSDDEFRYPASYLNFYIGNQVVLVPIFDDPHDEIVIKKLEKIFPGRKIVGVNARAMVEGFGTIHCATQQQPEI